VKKHVLFAYLSQRKGKRAREYCKKVKSACKSNGITYKGCYGPPQDRYSYAIFMEDEKAKARSPNYDAFTPIFSESGAKPPQMGHVIMKYYVHIGF